MEVSGRRPSLACRSRDLLHACQAALPSLLHVADPRLGPFHFHFTLHPLRRTSWDT